jgi:hypothetical protein
LQWVDGLRPQQKSDTQLSPDLRISIAGMQVFTDVSGLTGFVLTVQVMNMGPVPTTAVGWSMTIITPDGKEWKEPPTNPPETLTMASTSRGTTVLKKEDFALESLTHKPLKKSDPAIKSMILFYFLADMNYLMNPLSKIELSAEDYAGKRYTDTELMGDFSGPPQSLPPVAGVVLKNVISTPFKPAQRTKISLSLHVDSTEFPIPVKVFTYTVVAPVFGHDKAKEEIISTTLWRELDSVRPFEDSLTSSDSDGIVIPSAPIPQDVYTDIVEGKKALYFLVKVLDKQNRDIYEFWGFMPRPEIAFVRECPPRRRVPTLR